MKKIIDCGEWYPVYYIEDIEDNSTYFIEIPDDKIAWIQRVNEEFDEVQEYLIKLSNEHELMDKLRNDS